VLDAVPGSVPVAFIAFDERDGPGTFGDRMAQLRELGYRGVKVHPRLTGTTFADPRLTELFAAAAMHDMRVLVCSYNFGHPLYHTGDLGPARLMAVIDGAPGVQVVVLHGGACNVLEWAEWVRSRDNVLLDLSFTIARYAGSSVDLDLQYLFRTLDQRLCVGSDHPQFELATLRQRFDKFSEGLPLEKAENIAFGNLARFFPESAP
jgi:predicted TIM-barrel fold metal-dependent hydrolase